MSGHETLSTEDQALLAVVILLVLILILLVLLFFCRHRLAKWFPCLVVKIKPEEKTGWHHVDRFGEVKLKVASHTVPESRATNVSLQVPVFEEKLHSTVKKKSVHMASTENPSAEPETPKRKKKKHSKHQYDPGSDTHNSPEHNEETV